MDTLQIYAFFIQWQWVSTCRSQYWSKSK